MSLQHIDTMIGFSVIMLLFSLLITVLVQMATSLFDLRGKNLLWGVQQLLCQLDPSLAKHAQDLARRVVTHPALAPWSAISFRRSGKARATAIRPDELVRVLGDLASDKSLDQATRDTLTQLLGPAGSAAPQLAAQIAQVAQSLKTAVPGLAGELTAAFTRVQNEIVSIDTKVKTWFDTIMDRTSERFMYHMRATTAVAAFLFAFLLHVDSLQIIRRVGEDRDLRARLVAQVEPTLNRADSVLSLADRGKPSGSTVLSKMSLDSVPGMPGVPVPPDLTSRAAGLAWIESHVPDAATRDSLSRRFQTRYAAADSLWLQQLRWAADGIDSTLKATSFSPVPSPVPPLSSYAGDRFPYLNSHFLGVLMSAMLLSLGAPFWYNALRTLANLRPIVAQKVNREGGGKGEPQRA